MTKPVSLTVSAATAAIFVLGYGGVARETLSAEAPPCEVSPPTVPTNTPPAAPKNLRIIGGLDALDFEEEATGSGPFVPEEFSGSEGAAVALAGPHDYYNALASRSDCLRAYSLRNPAQLATRENGGFSVQNDRPPAVTYDPAGDTYPFAQDAAKVVINPGGNNLTNQVRLPIPTHAPESLFVTWDGWFGDEWKYGVHGIPDQKTWQFGSPFNDIHTEVRNRYAMANNQAPGNIAIIDGRQYNSAYSVGPNITSFGTLEPRVGTFVIKPRTWTRWFAHFKAPGAGQIWWEYSLWAADAQTGPVLIYDKLQIRPGPDSLTGSWESFWLEFNTSTSWTESNKLNRPPLVAYVRNVVMLKGLDSVGSLLQRPSN
jgi:hypothetical protein